MSFSAVPGWAARYRTCWFSPYTQHTSGCWLPLLVSLVMQTNILQPQFWNLQHRMIASYPLYKPWLALCIFLVLMCCIAFLCWCAVKKTAHSLDCVGQKMFNSLPQVSYIVHPQNRTMFVIGDLMDAFHHQTPRLAVTSWQHVDMSQQLLPFPVDRTNNTWVMKGRNEVNRRPVTPYSNWHATRAQVVMLPTLHVSLTWHATTLPLAPIFGT